MDPRRAPYCSHHQQIQLAVRSQGYGKGCSVAGTQGRGSSAINFSGFFRGIPEDFDSWASMGNDDWRFDEVLPYFRKLETDVDQHGDYHGTEGPIFVHHASRESWPPAQVAFYNACRAAGFADCPDHNSPGATGIGPSITNNHNRVRFSTALGYLSQGRHRVNLTIKPNYTAHRVLFECR